MLPDFQIEMKEIFLGFAFDKEKAEEMLKNSRVGLQTAANQYQLGFLEGLCRPIEILSVLPVGAFPFGNTNVYFQKLESETRYGRITYLPFVNIFGLKDLSQQKNIYRVLSKMLSDTENATLYVYGLYLPFLNG